MSLLPELILIRAGRAKSLGLEKVLEVLAAETTAKAPGSQPVIQRLAELVLIQALRENLGKSTDVNTGLFFA